MTDDNEANKKLRTRIFLRDNLDQYKIFIGSTGCVPPAKFQEEETTLQMFTKEATSVAVKKFEKKKTFFLLILGPDEKRC